jgi:hypothetical protein
MGNCSRANGDSFTATASSGEGNTKLSATARRHHDGGGVARQGKGATCSTRSELSAWKRSLFIRRLPCSTEPCRPSPSRVHPRQEDPTSRAIVQGSHESKLFLWSDDAAKTEMARRGIDRLRHARSRSIAPAIIRRAKIRPALHYFARDSYRRRGRIVTLVALAAHRVEARAARMGSFTVLLVPVRSPFPNIAGHIIQTVIAGRQRRR